MALISDLVKNAVSLVGDIAKTQKTQTAYQQNVSKPVQQESNPYMDMMKNIWNVYQQNQEQGNQMLNDFHALQQDRSSIYYNPFLQPTNKAVNNLANYGVDASTLTDDWFAQNNEWQSYLNYNGQTNTPSMPSARKSSMRFISIRRARKIPKRQSRNGKR